ncbi:motile sperm domain-containing protein 2-like isoform X3 [Centropristis striata]|uniref:motile sperm domain-containing protein 2-like isoform X3 n=1 Tax=Centropristis striata TaxID=184440 RepID=UPI0027E12CEA|nr:motile sperm domain-containing protein 2-like isoform X3 [Centropristis striata]XP_059183634.1 motile sperm domain-containing protein 2-like isoform X3 [Centropristis striata]
MTVEMELSTNEGNQDLEQIWEKIRPLQRLSCPILQDVEPFLRQTLSGSPGTSDRGRINATLLQVLASSRRLEQKLDQCIWTQKVFIVLVIGLTALWGFTLYIHFSTGYSKWTTAKN